MSSNNIDVGKTFNKFASVFNEVSNQYTTKRRYQKASSFSKGKLLDIGGASGLFLSFLNADIQPIVLDISYNMCLETKLNHGVDIVCADAEKLPFPDNSFPQQKQRFSDFAKFHPQKANSPMVLGPLLSLLAKNALKTLRE